VQAQRVCLVLLSVERGLDQQPLPRLARAGQFSVGRDRSVNKRTVLADKPMQNLEQKNRILKHMLG